MLSKYKLAGITLLVGAAATILVYGMLAAERGRHAATKEAYAAYKVAAAEASLAQVVAFREDTERLQERLAAALQQQADLQRALRDDQVKRANDRRSADARIEELKRENKALADWAALAVPDGWVDFMCEPAGCTAPANP